LIDRKIESRTLHNTIMTTTINFGDLPFDATKYFVSSKLFDAGSTIDCPNDLTKSFIENINDPTWITRSLMQLSLSKKIELYDFMDQYCISRGTLRLFKNSLEQQLSYDPETANTIYVVNYKDDIDRIYTFSMPIKYIDIGTTIKINGYHPTQVVSIDKTNKSYHIFGCTAGSMKMTMIYDIDDVPSLIITEQDDDYSSAIPRKIKIIFTGPSL